MLTLAENSILIPRMQFLCIEIARTFECYNFAITKPIEKFVPVAELDSLMTELQASLSEASLLRLFSTMQRLICVDVTRASLLRTQAGKVIAQLTRHSDIGIKSAARNVLRQWKWKLRNAEKQDSPPQPAQPQPAQLQPVHSASAASIDAIAELERLKQLVASICVSLQQNGTATSTRMFPHIAPTSEMYHKRVRLLHALGFARLLEQGIEITLENAIPEEALNLARLMTLSLQELDAATHANSLQRISDETEFAAKFLIFRFAKQHRGLLFDVVANLLTSEASIDLHRVKGVSWSVERQRALPEIEVELATLLERAELDVERAVKALAEQKGLTHETPLKLNELWSAVFEQIFQSAMLQATTNVGTKQQLNTAAPVERYVNVQLDERINAMQFSALQQDGYIVLDSVISREQAIALRADLDRLQPLMEQTFQNVGTRSDSIKWISEDASELADFAELREAIVLVKSVAHALSQHIEQRLVVPKVCMAAVYRDGSFYTEHRDNTCSTQTRLCSNPRKFTALLYVNPDWNPSNGGVLRAYTQKRHLEDAPAGCLDSCSPETPCHVDIEPIGGRLLIFPSEVLPHEVRHGNAPWKLVFASFRCFNLSSIHHSLCDFLLDFARAVLIRSFHVPCVPCPGNCFWRPHDHFSNRSEHWLV
jgi:Rps23 Pro-64 3,4-dihydroxylase Tpa1-like proline 4-hydroxylase